MHETGNFPPHQILDGRVILDAQGLKSLRKRRGLSQEAAAELCLDHRLCLSLASIKRAEAGKPVLYRTARHLASFYGTEVETLIRQQSAQPGCYFERMQLVPALETVLTFQSGLLGGERQA